LVLTARLFRLRFVCMHKPNKLLVGVGLSLLLVVLLVPQVASADLTKEYLKNRAVRAQHVFRSDVWTVIQAAEAAEKEGNMDEALDLFRQAMLLEQTPSTEAEYGLALLRAKQYLPAARYLVVAQRVQGHTAVDLQYPHSFIQEATTEAVRQVGLLFVDCNLPQVKLIVGGQLITDWPYMYEIPVEPDEEVEVTAIAPGYFRSFQKVKVEKGHTKMVRIGMVPVADSMTIIGMPANVNMSVNDGRMGNDYPTWPRKMFVASGVGMGLAATGLGIGLVTGANATTEQNKTMGTGLTITGVILGGLSLTGIIIAASEIASRPTPPPQITIAPTVGVNPNEKEGGVKIEGKF